MNSVAPYPFALRKIYSLDKFGSKLGLGRITAILRELGSPEKKYRCIIVGGSNGKGSTVEFIGEILRRDGARVGTYFSPQIEEFTERIRVDGKNASKREIALAYSEVARAARKVARNATFFEIVTAMALLIFARRKVQFAVLEVGLGGMLDATNAVEPEVSAITSVSLEHTDVLGKSLAAIAHEKCGIARKERPLVCGRMGREAEKAVMEEGKTIGAKVVFADATRLQAKLSAPGEFQRSNAAVAAGVCKEIGVGRRAIAEGLRNCVPRFRLERRGNLLLDCAHNPEAAGALAKEVGKIRVKKKVLLFSAMKDKNYPAVLRALAPKFGRIVVTEVKLDRGASVAELKRTAGSAIAEKDAKAALARAKGLAGNGGLVVIAGSIYLLAELFGKDNIHLGQ